jgi:hypothetical protein
MSAAAGPTTVAGVIELDASGAESVDLSLASKQAGIVENEAKGTIDQFQRTTKCGPKPRALSRMEHDIEQRIANSWFA